MYGKSKESATSNDVAVPNKKDALQPNEFSTVEKNNERKPPVTGTSRDATVARPPSKRSRTSSVPFKPGMYVEAKDFAEIWYSAKVVEVDYDGREVLVHFLNWSSRYDEWISMESNRLREAPQLGAKPASSTSQASTEVTKEPFKVGDKILAPWTGGGKKYPAQITNILPEDNLEVVFIDGLESTIKASKVTRLPKEQADKLVIPDPTHTEEEREVKEPEVMSKQERRLLKKKFSIADLTASRKRVSDQRGNPQDYLDPAAYISDDDTHVSVKNTPKEIASATKEEKKSRFKKNEFSEPAAKKKRISNQRSNLNDFVDPSCISDEEPEEMQKETSERSDSPPTVRLEDPKLPSGWSKKACRRLLGSSLGKWDVFILSPDGKKFRKKEDLVQYMEQENLTYDIESFDFGMTGSGKSRSKLNTPEDDATSFSGVPTPISAPTKRRFRGKKRKPSVKAKLNAAAAAVVKEDARLTPSMPVSLLEPRSPIVSPLIAALSSIERPTGVEKYICPQDGCEKQFRNENLLQMHIKHYHPELHQAFGGGPLPNVYDLAYARTAFDRPLAVERKEGKRTPKESKVKASPVSSQPSQPEVLSELASPDLPPVHQKRTASIDGQFIAADSAAEKLEQFKKPKLELQKIEIPLKECEDIATPPVVPVSQSPLTPYETLHSMLLGPKISRRRQALLEKRGLWPVGATLGPQEDEELDKEASKDGREAEASSPGLKLQGDVTRGPGRPKKIIPGLALDGAVSGSEAAGDSTPSLGPETEEMQRDRGEVVHCICGIPEEEGLMVQCELCHGWQHGYCFGMETVSDVPERYLCYVCKMPYKERRSQHFMPYLSWLQEGLPSLKHKDSSQASARAEGTKKRTVVFRKTNALVSAGLEVKRILQSLDVKLDIAKKKDHPKLYLWNQPWRKPENEKLVLAESPGNSPLPMPTVKSEVVQEEKKREVGEDLSKVGADLEASFELPVETTTDLEQLAAASEQLTGSRTARIPEPEKPIDSLECRLNMLTHVEQMQDMLDDRLDAIERAFNDINDDGEDSDVESERVDTICRILSTLSKDVRTLRELSSC